MPGKWHNLRIMYGLVEKGGLLPGLGSKFSRNGDREFVDLNVNAKFMHQDHPIVFHKFPSIYCKEVVYAQFCNERKM